MSLIHPAFSAIENPEIGEALSAPFVNPNGYTVFNNQHVFAAEEVTPFMVGVMIFKDGGLQFVANVSRHSTTPLNHVTGYLDHYSDQVGRAQAPVFEGKADNPMMLDVIASMQGNTIRIAREDRLLAVSGFMLGLVGESQMTIAGLIVGRRAFEESNQAIEASFGMAEPVFEQAYAEEAEDNGGRESMRESLIATTKELSIPAYVGRLLPTHQAVKDYLIEIAPNLEEFYAATHEAQGKVLGAERIEANRLN